MEYSLLKQECYGCAEQNRQADNKNSYCQKITSVKINFKRLLPLIWLRSYWTDFSPHQFDSALANENKGIHKNNGTSGTL